MKDCMPGILQTGNSASFPPQEKYFKDPIIVKQVGDYGYRLKDEYCTCCSDYGNGIRIEDVAVKGENAI